MVGNFDTARALISGNQLAAVLEKFVTGQACPVTQHDDGRCTLSYGSAEVSVTVHVFDDDQAVVKVRAAAGDGA